MKGLRLIFIMAVAALVTLGLSGAAFAYHSGGVAECEGCHTMHNSKDGASMIEGGTVGIAGPYLLQASDQSSTCLNCHGPVNHETGAPASGGYHILSTYQSGTGVSNYTPGGDFAWLTKTFSWVPRSGASTEYSYGYQHGHNVIAADYGLDADGRLTQSPGGNYPAIKNGNSTFGCHSCHDPHGKHRILTTGAESDTGEPIYSSGSYGADPTTIGTTKLAVGMYRILGSVGYQPMSLAGSYAFTQNAMRAAAPSSYNAAEGDINGMRVAYGAYSADWCANCHNAMHSVLSSVAGSKVHPTGTTIPGFIAANYNAYVKTGTMDPTQTKPYVSLVGFQSDQYGKIGDTNGNSTLNGIRGGWTGITADVDRVNCFSCHRAHASGWDSMTRYPIGNEFMTTADSSGNPVYTAKASVGMGRTELEYQSGMNGRPATVFAAYQRVLCNKCHAKD